MPFSPRRGGTVNGSAGAGRARCPPNAPSVFLTPSPSPVYGLLHRPHLSRQKPLPHVLPGQCELLMHGWPMSGPPTHVFTHMAPGPPPLAVGKATHVAGVAQGTARQAISDGHGHGPGNG